MRAVVRGTTSLCGPLLFSLYTTPLSKVIGRHSNIKFHFYANDTQLFVHFCYKNAALAFEKLNYCFQDFQELMSSTLKLNPEKMEFIIFGSHAQLKKLDFHLSVKIFSKLMHPSVVKNRTLVYSLMLSFPLLIMSQIFIKLASFKCVNSGRSDSI